MSLQVDLDRFSRPMPWELRSQQHVDVIEEVKIICEGCGEEIIEGDDYQESELWEDEFVHDLDDCIRHYYETEGADLPRQDQARHTK